MDIRYRYRTRISQADPAEQAGFYQCRHDGDRAGQLLRLLRILFIGRRGPAGCRELFADYNKKKTFGRDSVLAELAAHDVVSFDVFDTLVMRSVGRPAGVFWKMEEKYGVPGFAQQRMEAERAARQRRRAQCGTAEVFIEDIYEVLSERRPAWHISAAQELEMELCCCRPDPVMQHIVQSLLAEGKRVIAVSDMYLHQEQLLRILHSCGYAGIGRLYVSCDWRAGKSDGRLFPAVLRGHEGSGQMAHVGDDFYADVYRPEGLGIRTIHYIKNRRGWRK